MDKTKKVKNNTITVFIIISIALTAFLAYKDIFGYFFTGLDTLNIIEESRFQSFSELTGLFKKTMTEEFAWYRPIADLFYGMVYFIWGLNPFGYFLTNLTLHIAAAVLVFLFVRILLLGRQLTAWLAAIIFATHPIHVENIPALRMNDIIATIFLLISLILFIKYFTALPQGKSYLLTLSVFFYILALGSKEIAVILPFLIFIYLMVFSSPDGKSLKKITFNAVIRCLPYIVITLFYLMLRSYVIGGIGGYTSSFGGSDGIINLVRKLINISILYFKDLIYPVDFLRLDSLFSPSPTTFKQMGFVVVLFCLGILLIYFFKKHGIKAVYNNDKRIIKIFNIFFSAVIIISSIGILTYPLLSPYINEQIQYAYDGKSTGFIVSQMENIGGYPVEFYRYKARELILNSSLLVLAISVIFLVIINQRITLKQSIMNSVNTKIKSFLIVWMLLPFFIYLVTVTFDHHDMYISVIPLSTLLCIVFVEAGDMAKQRKGLLKFIVTTVILISFITYSPLVRTYGEWKASGEIQRMFLDKLSQVLPELPDNAVIHVYNFPNGISSFKTETLHAQEVAYYADFSIKAWLDINYPHNQMKVIMHDKIEIPNYPVSMELEVEKGKENNVNINIMYNGKKLNTNLPTDE